MTSLKLCGTAIALLVGTAVPSFAQNMPDEVVVRVLESGTAYRVPASVADDICGSVSQDVLLAVSGNPDTVYCTVSDATASEQGFTGFSVVDQPIDLDGGSDDHGDDNGNDDDDGAADDDNGADDNGNDGNGNDDNGGDDNGNDDNGNDDNGNDDNGNDDNGGDNGGGDGGNGGDDNGGDDNVNGGGDDDKSGD